MGNYITKIYLFEFEDDDEIDYELVKVIVEDVEDLIQESKEEARKRYCPAGGKLVAEFYESSMPTMLYQENGTILIPKR